MTLTYHNIKKLNLIEVEKHEAQTSIEDELNNLLGELNPRYFEETHTPVEAKERIYTLLILQKSNYSLNMDVILETTIKCPK